MSFRKRIYDIEVIYSKAKYQHIDDKVLKRKALETFKIFRL